MALTKITSDVIGTGAVTSDHLASGAVTHSSLSSITTDNVSEGSSNTYFTNARARSSVSVTGGGLSYDSGTGVIQIGSIPNASLTNSSLTVNSNSVSLGGSVTLDTDDIGEGSTNLYFTNARAQGAISGGTGVTVSSGTISIGQDVATSSTPTFGNITTTGYIAGPATFTIDPAAVGDNTGTVVIAGNLQVDGTTTTINSTTMEVDDLNITLASGAANAAAANGAGITVDGASATITYDGTNDEWDFNKDINVTGTVTFDGGTTSADLNFGDSDKAIFGADSDLQIYHDGSHSYIDEVGTGRLYIRAADNITLTNADGSEIFANFGNNGAVGFRYDNALKLITTSTGIDVTGTVVADNAEIGTGGASNANAIVDLTGDTTYTDFGFRIIRNSGANGNTELRHRGTGNLNIEAVEAGNIVFETSDLERMRIDSSGDINIVNTGQASLNYTTDGSLDYARIQGGKYDSGVGDLRFFTYYSGLSERMRINAAGGLSINDDVEVPISLNRATTTTGASYMSFTNGGGNAFVGVDSSLGNRMFVGGTSANAYALTFTTESARPIIFATNNSQRMSIASDGKIDMYPSGAETTGGLRVVYDGDNNYEVARFQSDGNYDAHVSFRTNGTNDYYWSAGIDYSDSGSFKISRDNLLATNNEFRIDTNGDVSLGANATGAASIKGVSGDQANRNAGGYPQYTFVGNEGTGMRRVASNELAFDTSGDERVRIDSNGNVGIGYLAENPPDTLMVKNTTNSQKILMHAASETADRGVALGMTVTGNAGVGAIYGTNKDLSSVTENLVFNPDGGPILMGAVPASPSSAHVTIDGRGDADTFRLSFDYGHPTYTSRGANLDFKLGNASASATRITTNYWPGGSGNIDISAYNRTNQILLEESGQVSFSDGYIKLGGYSYVGEDLLDNDSLHLMSDYTENIIFGQRDRANNVWTESFRIDRYGNMNAPGTIVQTVRADANNVVGTGDFDVISVNITPKFANSDMIIHFYTQWSVSTNDGEDWGMKLLRDGTTVQGDTVNGYFISGGGVDASDHPLAQTSYGAPQYYVRFASKTDIDTGRSSSTGQMTYKIRKVVPAGTSTKTVRFGVDGWTGGTVEANRSRIVLMVQEVMPN